MAVNLYIPKPVVIPNDLPFKREIRDTTDFLTASPIQDTINYDFKTIFYDVFFDSENSKIHAVGPPLINLSKELPFKIIHKGKELNYHCNDYLQCSILTIPQNFEEDEVELFFDFKHFSQVIPVRKESSKPSRFAVVACQKNNQIKWVKTWCAWYKKFYNADIVLYDNGSENLSVILEEIKDFDPTVIQWNYKFGPYRTFYNMFCQVAAYNHFQLKYKFQYGLVFDIDEYLISKVDLNNYLNEHPECSLFLLDNYYIPNVREKTEDFGIEDFYYRPPHLRNRAFKYIFRRDLIQYLDIHNALVKKGEKISVPGNMIYFNHYKGLSTHWKPWDERDKIESLTGDLIPDTEARKYIDKLSCIE